MYQYSVLNHEDDVKRLLQKTSACIDYIDVQAGDYVATVRNHWPLLRSLKEDVQRVGVAMSTHK